MTNVVFEDLSVADGSPLQDGITVDAFYKATNPSCPEGWRPPAAPVMANYTFRNIVSRCILATEISRHKARRPPAPHASPCCPRDAPLCWRLATPRA